ncbi:transglutaminase domain-containing protein [Patescibacteria group bacterium]|nr:transglutaminase domain-containing protein [Patescibacteria group bacterium]
MKKISFLFLFLTLLSVGFLFTKNKVYASASPFSVHYNILYNITKGGNANVSYNIRLINLSASTYASSYTIDLTSTDITNLSVVNNSSGNPLPFTQNKGKTSTQITTTFPNTVYGYGTSQNWTINFTTDQIAKRQGKLLNVVIPGFQQKGIITKVDTTVETPKSLGGINFVSTPVSNISSNTNNNIFEFNTKSSYTTEGILLIVGNYQLYSFKFHYKLQNTNIFNNESFKIVIPADFSTQTVIFSKISPTPTKAYIDQNGNYIIEYILPPRKTVTALINGEAKVLPTYNVLSTPLKRQNLSAQSIKIYTSAQPYWQVASPFIHNLAEKIIASDTTTLEKAQSIQNYVAGHLTYNDKAILDSSRQRLGAIKALEEPTNAICQEYTDVFVALARSVGIPTRMIAGYGDPPNVNVNPLPPNILHAWVQFYDPSYGWVNADPTWQSTSGGFNFFGNVGSDHFILAKYGTSSVNPPLILTFVKEKNPQNNINIEAINSGFNPNPTFNMHILNYKNLISGFQNNLKLYIQNTGNEVLRGQSIDIKSSKGVSIGKVNISNTAIFPQMSQVINIPVKTSNYFTGGNREISITASFYNYHKNNITKKTNAILTFSPLFISGIIPWIMIIILLIISIIIVDIAMKIRKKGI